MDSKPTLEIVAGFRGTVTAVCHFVAIYLTLSYGNIYTEEYE